MKTFRDIIVNEVQRRGWSGYRLAKQAGLPLRAVQDYLAGNHDILAERYAALCRVLGFELKLSAEAAKESHTGPPVNAKRPGGLQGRGKASRARKARQ